MAVVKKILGKASEVTIPYTVEGMIADNQTAQWDVVGIDLYTEAVAPNVTKITLPKTCSTYLYKDAYVAVGAQQMRELVARAYSVAAIGLETATPAAPAQRPSRRKPSTTARSSTSSPCRQASRLSAPRL